MVFFYRSHFSIDTYNTRGVTSAQNKLYIDFDKLQRNTLQPMIFGPTKRRYLEELCRKKLLHKKKTDLPTELNLRRIFPFY